MIRFSDVVIMKHEVVVTMVVGCCLKYNVRLEGLDHM